MADESQRRLLSNQAARGKVGSGGTAEALQTSLLLLGQDLLNNNISQRMGLTTLGANAAAGQASATQASGNTIVDLITGKGNVLAAGEVGAANARTQGFRTSMDHAAGVNDIVGTVFDGISLSDARFKEDIKPIGSIDSVPVYTFRYAGEQTTRIGVMAQDVEQTHPHAVQEFNGVKYVNYGELWR